MIYALLDIELGEADRKRIAVAILARDRRVLRRFADDGKIIHIMDLNEQRPNIGPRHCIYCLDRLIASDYRGPKELVVAGFWHFEHATINDCIGRIRKSPVPHALGIKNPANHGCYVELGCELDPEGRPTEWEREKCRTIEGGNTYCHTARRIDPSCF